MLPADLAEGSGATLEVVGFGSLFERTKRVTINAESEHEQSQHDPSEQLPKPVAAPGRPLLEQLGPCHGDQQDRRVPGPVGHVLDEVQEGGLAPMDVVEDEDQGFAARQRLEGLADGPEDLIGRWRTVLDAEQARPRWRRPARPPALRRAPLAGDRRPSPAGHLRRSRIRPGWPQPPANR